MLGEKVGTLEDLLKGQTYLDYINQKQYLDYMLKLKISAILYLKTPGHFLTFSQSIYFKLNELH
jgi:hypothetical protein